MATGARSAPLARTLALLASVMLAPLAFRVVLIANRTGGFAAQDLRGFLSDAAMSLLVLAVLVVLSLASRLAAALVAAAWVLLQYGNHETVRELGALASALDAHFLGDATFVLGSVLAISKPVLLGALLVTAPILAWTGLRAASPRAALAGLLAGALLVGVHSLWPWTAQLAVWRQTNFLQYNAERWVLAGWRDRGPGHDFPDPAAAMLDLLPGLAADLDGEPIIPPDGRAKNVLLVIVESVSGSHVESIAQSHGRFVRKSIMPELDAIARTHLTYSTFFAHQRKTNRGLFTILCGELPNLAAGFPKMSEFSERGWRACLPDLLRDAGYRTVYLQAAPLAFMLKDQFMPKIGFEQVFGHKWFEGHYARSKWGVDDRAFFEQSLEMIEELRSGEKPWFLALLTVGSHHPFVLPPEFQHLSC